MEILSYLKIFRHSLHNNALTMRSMRTLYTEKFLRVTDYESQRLELKKNVPEEYLQPDVILNKIKFQLRSENIEELTKTLKQWIHVVDTKQCKENFPLLKKCLHLVHNNPHPDPTKNFNFAPVVMRMFHLLNMPDEALNIALNLESMDMFNQNTSRIILCDLLFNNGMYKELIRIVQRIDAVNEKRGMKSSHLQNCITFAASYKLNTQAHLSYALEIWNKSVKEHQISQAINFLSMNAINLDQAEIALDILPSNDKHFASLYIRLIALSDCGKFAEATEVLRSGLNQGKIPNTKIPQSVVKRVRQSLIKHPPTEDANDFNHLLDDVQNPKTKITIDEILCWPVSFNSKKFVKNNHRSQQN